MNRSKAVLIIVLIVIVAAAVASVAVFRRNKALQPPLMARAAVVPAEHVESADSGPGFGTGIDYNTFAKKDKSVVPAVADYEVKPNLSNVANLKVFKSVLKPDLVRMIAKNKFAVVPTNYTQMFYVYENNEYQRPQKFPSFITTDSMLHTYHVFYDYSLREVETYYLFDDAVKITEGMMKASQADLDAARSPDIKDAARRNLAYFAVAMNLLTGTPAPKSVADLANPDLAKISSHEERDMSTVMGEKIDFSQFVPRGHYTRSETLKKYFRAMMWYGLVPIPTPQGKIGPGPTRQALMMVRNLRTQSLDGKPLLKLWDAIYQPTAFYVGTADDYTVYQYADLSDKVFGKNPSIEAFAEKTKLDQFIDKVKHLPGPGIENFVAKSKIDSSEDPYYPVGRQFRLMGQRFIADSRILQELTHPKADGRNFPKGLDPLAAMGSDRALKILNDTYKCSESFPDFDKQMVKMRKEMAKTRDARWQSNIYYGWLWTLQTLVKPAPKGYPAFMRNDAWIDKCLFGALGSWTELRHDTILYAKQSVAECGGDGDEEEIKTPKGYVEPNLEFWTKLAWLNTYTEKGLSGRGLLNDELKDKFVQLGDWIDFCRDITIKELTNKKVTEEDYGKICTYGSDLEGLTLKFFGGDILSDADKDMAVVADVHTSFGNVLEEGTGRAAAIYVVVPIEGKLYITRGATYTQYEFEHPSSDRLTDEQWQKMLNSGQEPGFAEWVKSFLIMKKQNLPPEFENSEGGC